jgi:hypothetical protein
MTLFGVSFLVEGMLTCLVPISLLIVFATFFTRAARRMPPNATPVRQPVHEQPQAAEPRFPENQG